jgi:GTP-binding protein YchF
MKVGFIGKRSSGKTSLFEAVSGLDLTNSQQGLINISNVKVRDPHIDELCEVFNPKKKTYAEFDLVDYNRSQDASDAVLGSPSLISKYRELDAIALVIGGIEDKSFVNSELNDLLTELNLCDVMILDAKIQRMKKGAYDKQELSLYEGILSKLENNEKVEKDSFSKEQLKLLSAFQLFCLKPMMLAINVSEEVLSSGFKTAELTDAKLRNIVISAELEKELNLLDPSAKAEFLKDLGLSEGVSERFIAMLYDTVDLISFYTVGEDEVRAWSIPKGSSALTAAGKIHSDIERGFIRASTMHYHDFMIHKDEKKAQAAGVVRSEGKEYIVQPGDIIHFKFNV